MNINTCLKMLLVVLYTMICLLHLVSFTYYWIYNYLCNQCLSPLPLWVWIPLRWGLLDTTLCDKVCQWLATGLWFSPVSSTNKTDRHDVTEILLKVVLNTINQTKPLSSLVCTENNLNILKISKKKLGLLPEKKVQTLIYVL